MKTNITYRRAALEKLFLIACLIVIAVWILAGQTVEIPTAQKLPEKISPAQMYARLLNEARQPWAEPTALPINKERDAREHALRNFQEKKGDQ